MGNFARCLLGAVTAMLLSFSAYAADGRITYAEIVASEEGYVLNADFDFELNSKLTDALSHGVALHFVAELHVERPRWYWLDKVVADRRLEYRLAYHAITRSYRLSIGNLHQSFDSLEEAVRTMQHIRNWFVASASDLVPGVSHDVELRFFHDTTQLPKLFQLSAVTNGRWTVDTDWLEWTFLPQPVTPR
ncbi:MAG: DUF4390 domain-containing protein [Azoarcus sp.]|jgi:hypothetical protein|nr:DUF4390 domain-containing protein [Azoarcus sp.]